MRKKWLWLVPLVVAGLAVVLLVPGVRWRVLGVLRGEAFYQGRPTSYWRNEYVEWVEHGPRPGTLNHLPTPTLFDQLKSLLPRPLPRLPFSVLSQDPKALPVLIELLTAEDPDVRMFTAYSLKRMGSPARVALPHLTPLLHDENGGTRQNAADAVVQVATDGDMAGLLEEMLSNQDPYVRMTTAECLGKRRLVEAAPALRAALGDPDEDVRKAAATALNNLGAEADAARVP
jgi:hypothetical protein